MIWQILIFNLISFSICFFLMPQLIKSLIKKKFYGLDRHKLTAKKVAEPGGIGIVFSFMITILIYVAFIVYSNKNIKLNLIAATMTVIISGLIGLVDDLLAIRWRYKILSAFIPAVPLMVLKAGESSMILPVIGSVNLGIFFSLIIVPLMVNFAINSFNMVAGFNGLEAGMGIISLITLLIAGIISNNIDVVVFVSCSIGATVAFFLFNKYPAKVFPGDTGTFTIGAMIISAIIIGNMEKLAIAIFFLYFIDFLLLFLFLKSGHTEKFLNIDNKERLVPPYWYNVDWIIPYLFKHRITEKMNVLIMFVLQIIVCVAGLLLFF